MRKIKFRGKQLYDIRETDTMYASKKDTWRYGSYVYAHKYIPSGEHGYLILNNYGECPIMCDKNTIGQYTGLKDSKGIEIYEGDILSVWYKDKEKDQRQIVEVFFEEGQFVVSHFAINLVAGRNNCSEVIGNIHENPELLNEIQ